VKCCRNVSLLVQARQPSNRPKPSADLKAGQPKAAADPARVEACPQNRRPQADPLAGLRVTDE